MFNVNAIFDKIKKGHYILYLTNFNTAHCIGNIGT